MTIEKKNFNLQSAVMSNMCELNIKTVCFFETKQRQANKVYLLLYNFLESDKKIV